MCFGSTDKASQAATQQQAAQQSAINTNVSSINDAFAGRQSQYDAYLKALNSSYQSQLGLQTANATRGLKFSLARGGLTGSSVAADQGGELQKELGQGQITAQEQAQAKVAGLTSSDEAERQQMISLAQSGANVGNVNQQVATSLKSNLDNAQSALGPNTLGNAFGNLTNTVTGMNNAYQTRLGLKAAQAYANPFSGSTSSNSGYSNPGGP